jgi:hypothetical protein
MGPSELPEPWLRGTLQEVPALQRAVLHALELAREDLERWCGPWPSICGISRGAWTGCSVTPKEIN